MAIDGSTADGYFKDVFGDLEDTVPEYAVLANKIPYTQRQRLGEHYAFAVRMTRGHGVTFRSGAASMTAFALNPVRSGQFREAQVSGSSLVARESFAYKPVLSATREGKEAFGDLFEEGVMDLYEGSYFYLEMQLLYGQTSIGAFAEAGAAAAQQTLLLTAASSAPGLWAQMEGALFDVYVDETFAVKRNATGTFTCDSIDYDASTGQVSLTFTASSTAEADAITVNDIIVPVGWYDSVDGHQSMAGLNRIITNTGTIFNIDASQYSTWRGNTLPAGGALTFKTVTTAAVPIAVRTNLNDELDCLLSPKTWTDLNDDVASVRRFLEKQGDAEATFGTDEIVYHGPTGKIRIVPHPMVKGGDAFLGSCSRNAKMVGASKPTFDLGVEGQNARFLRELPDNAGFEIRTMWDLAIFSPRPRGWTKISGIVNTA